MKLAEGGNLADESPSYTVAFASARERSRA